MTLNNPEDKANVSDMVLSGGLGYIGGHYTGVVGSFGIPTYARMTLDTMIRRGEKLTLPVDSVEKRMNNLTLWAVFYMASVSSVYTAAVNIWHNVSNAVSGDGPVDYWYAPLVLTNTLSAVHESLRGNARYQEFYQKRVNEPMHRLLDRMELSRKDRMEASREETKRE